MGNSIYTNSIYATSNRISVDIVPSSKTYYSASHFSNECTIRYTVGNRTCTLRVTGYADNDYCYKACVALLDYCDGDEARANYCVGTESDINGSRIGSGEITDKRNVAMNNHGENKVSLSYGSSLREGLMIIERRKEYLIIAHNYWCIDKAQCLILQVEIKCDRRRGLFVRSVGPFQNYTNLRAMQVLHSQRIRSMREGSDSPNNTLQLQSAVNATRGLINNINGQTNGSYNGSVNITNNYYYNREEVGSEGYSPSA